MLARRATPPTTPQPGSAREVVIGYVDAAAAAHVRARAADGTPGDGEQSCAGGEVTVLCVTRRPERLGDVVDNVLRQSLRPHLLLVCHGEGFSEAYVSDAIAAVAGATWMPAPAAWTLGACLNAGLERCATRYVAKLDDDDAYGDRYLEDAVRTANATGATVVGKQSHFVYLTGRDVTILRFPGRQCRPASHLAGGTLLLDRQQLGRVRFPDVTVGEDRGLIGACLWRGKVVYAGDMFNYLQRRGGENTWRATEQYLASGALELGVGEQLDRVLI